MAEEGAAVLEARGLSLSLPGMDVPLPRDLDFDLVPGRCLGLVGPSGSGKTLLALCLLGLQPVGVKVEGALRYGGQELLADPRRFSALRGRALALMPQQPTSSLNPVRTVGAQLAAPLPGPGRERRRRLADALAQVGLAPAQQAAYPHQLSGGECQRVALARALLYRPRVLIVDEPTASLDSVARAGILELLAELQRKRGLALLFISHDREAVARLAQEVLTVGEIPAPGTERPGVIEAAREPESQRPLLQASALQLAFPGREEPVLDRVSLDVGENESVALVGESGCGKTTLARALLGLQPLAGGRVLVQGRPLEQFPRGDRMVLRRLLQIVFQDPVGSLDPRQRVREVLVEALALHGRAHDREACVACLHQVDLSAALLERFPHQLSGGQRQRVALARSLAPRPALLVCDEPVSSLDRDQQFRLLDLLAGLRRRHGMAQLLITHDLSLVRRYCTRVLVMARGRIVEEGAPESILERPRDPATRRLVGALRGLESGTAAATIPAWTPSPSR